MQASGTSTAAAVVGNVGAKDVKETAKEGSRVAAKVVGEVVRPEDVSAAVR